MGRFSHFSSLRKLISLGTTFYWSAIPPAVMLTRLFPPTPQPTCSPGGSIIRAQDLSLGTRHGVDSRPAQPGCSTVGRSNFQKSNVRHPDDVYLLKPSAKMFSHHSAAAIFVLETLRSCPLSRFAALQAYPRGSASKKSWLTTWRHSDAVYLH